MWLITSQIAFWPQGPGHGFLHLLLKQALSRGQSLLMTHSGRHIVYGSPWYSGKHVQIPFEHWAFGPQGDGLHGSSRGGSLAKWNILFFIIKRKPETKITKSLTWRWFGMTICERIACILFWAWARRCMIDDSTYGIETTCTQAWVSTLFLNTCFVTWAFWIDGTFWAAVWRWTNVCWQTRTRRRSIDITTLWKWSTWRWIARISVIVFNRW